MNKAFPIDCYRTGIHQITLTVFETMLGLAVEPLEDPCHDGPDSLTGAAYYAGDWKGALLLECSPAQAADWAARLMSLRPPVAPEDVRDGLGELTNIVAGNLKAILPPRVGLSIPSVVEGSDYNLRICGGNLFEVLRFRDLAGPFRITLVEVIEAPFHSR